MASSRLRSDLSATGLMSWVGERAQSVVSRGVRLTRLSGRCQRNRQVSNRTAAMPAKTAALGTITLHTLPARKIVCNNVT